jgi:para-aminobenzoate synthetase/4-amino-4-deoxychorismate lyase
VDKESVWFYHKTSRRELYGTMYKRAREDGLFDICFYNEQGEVTEGCITNIIIENNGEYFTPPLSSGLLAGVMRQHLLNDDKIPLREQVLHKKDMVEAEAIYLCNSVRGVVKVSLEDCEM